MRAAFCTQPGRFELRPVDTPQARENEAIVKVRNCGICGSDLHFFHGGFPPPPVCPGHEISGEVVAINGAAAVAVGDRVAVEPLVVCGRCPRCRSGEYQLCDQLRILGTMRDGGFADYVRVPARALFRLPDSVDYEVGALTEPLAVCVHAVRLAGVTLGQRVLVLGAGTIGLLSAFAARAAGAAEVWVTARHPHQADMARALGATRVFTPDDAAIGGAAEAAPVDAVIETVGGSADTVNQGVHLVRKGGSVVVLGVFTTGISIDGLSLIAKEVRIIGSLTYGRPGPRAEFEIALQLLAAQPELFRRLITHRFPLDELTRGFQTALDKQSRSIKVTITP